jgi:hypothetical protein
VAVALERRDLPVIRAAAMADRCAYTDIDREGRPSPLPGLQLDAHPPCAYYPMEYGSQSLPKTDVSVYNLPAPR